jgi:hypothetical protein
MTAETIRTLFASGFFMMLLLLRLEANRFGAAEFDEPGSRPHPFRTRLSWYAIGFVLLGALYVAHPAPHDVLVLLAGHGSDVIFYGALLAVLGLAQAPVLAWWRYGYLRLPATRTYPGAALNSVATAVIDEATYRGALLGTLIAMGLADGEAVVIATLVYVLTTRMAAPGRHRYMLLLAAGMGLACGWATLASDGLGAAIIGHTVASFAFFVCTGHAGQVPVAGGEPEEVEYRKMPPEGWRDARLLPISTAGVQLADLQPIEPSGFGTRLGRQRSAAEQKGLLATIREAVEILLEPPSRRTPPPRTGGRAPRPRPREVIGRGLGADAPDRSKKPKTPKKPERPVRPDSSARTDPPDGRQSS